MRHLITASLILVGIIHLLPVVGVLSAERLSALYGLQISEPNLLILMRHRAVLFALLGVFLIVASFKPAWQGGALIAGLISVSSFMLLAWSIGGYNAQLARVVLVDMVALVALLIGAGAYLYLLRSN